MKRSVIIIIVGLFVATNSFAKRTGVCGAEGDGSNLTWTLARGVLTISGTGAMADYDKEYSKNGFITTTAPWGKHSSSLKRLVINEGITYIGKCAFFYCSTIKGSLTIPNSVVTIGELAFSGCRGFTGDLTIPNSVETIGGGAFQSCSGFTGSLTIPNSVYANKKIM